MVKLCEIVIWTLSSLRVVTTARAAIKGNDCVFFCWPMIVNDQDGES